MDQLSTRRKTALFVGSSLVLASIATLAGCSASELTNNESATRQNTGSVSEELQKSQNTAAVISSLSWGTPQTIGGVLWDGTEVTTSFEGETFTLTTNSIPNHERDEYYAVPDQGVVVPDETSATIAKDPTKEQDLTFEIPTSPKYTNTITTAPLGSIGVMISGATLYNPYEGDGKTVAMSSNFTISKNGKTASFVDECAGHPTPQGSYHYHANSSCVTRQVDSSGEASHIIGIALDGFPIYGAYDINGIEVTADKLDECNGIYSSTPEFPEGIYHYVLPNTTDATSSIRCFHGVVDTSQIQQMPPMLGNGAKP